MADGNLPDQTQALLALQQYSSQMQGNGKPAYLFGLIPIEINVGSSLSATVMSPFSKPIPGLFKDPDNMGGLAGKFFKAVRQAADDAAKCAKEAGVMYSGDLPSGNMPGGANISGPSSGIELN